MTPILIMMVGLPASGKSTLRKKLNEVFPTSFGNVSIDDYLEAIMAKEGLSYRKAFEGHIWNARVHTDTEVELYTEAFINVLWEGAHLKASARRKKLSSFANYHKIAVVVEQPPDSEWKRRLAETSKGFSSETLKNMEKAFVYPTKQEGFDKIFKTGQEQNLIWYIKGLLNA